MCLEQTMAAAFTVQQGYGVNLEYSDHHGLMPANTDPGCMNQKRSEDEWFRIMQTCGGCCVLEGFHPPDKIGMCPALLSIEAEGRTIVLVGLELQPAQTSLQAPLLDPVHQG